MSKNLELDDTTMEKKIFAPKGCLMLVDASRLRQDASGGQGPSLPFPRSKGQGRSRREPAASSISVGFRPEPTGRKNASKGNRKGKNVDELEQVGEKNEGSAEFGSLQLPGSRKQNLNHLLNFHFTPREFHGRGGAGHFHHPARPIRSKPVNDGCFIQANCQFVVSSEENVEYHVDSLVNWKSVEQIIIRTCGTDPGCPICLAPPSAAKITKCGHMFCWSCILRYFSYGEGRTQPCPICFKSIVSEDLKSVVANVMEEFHVGDMVNLQLMCRKKESSSGSMPVSSKLGVDVKDWEKRFQKLLRLTPTQVRMEVLERERKELSSQLEGTIESLETEFVMAAMRELDNRMSILLEKISRGYGAVPVDLQKDNLVVGDSVEVEPGACALPQREDVTTRDSVAELKVSGAERAGEVFINSDDYSCFYQAADGSNAFMAPLNMAMCWKSFGQNPSSWPQTIPLRVIEIEFLTVTPELRKRLRFLQHVPLNSSIQLMEFELKGIVSQDVLGEFQHQLSERKRRRSERVRLEKRRDRIQQEAERLANLEPTKPMIGSLHDFPECGSPEEEAQALEYAIQASLADAQEHMTGPGTACTDPIPMSTRKPLSDSISFPCISEISTSPSLSFAQALSTPSLWKRSPTFPVTMKPGGQTSASSSSTTVQRQRGTSDGELDQDGSSVPEFRASVSDAIASAFANFEMSAASNNEAEGGGAAGGSTGQKKKGRKKGTVLFATGMGRKLN